MDHVNEIFNVELHGSTAIVTPKSNLTEFDFAQIELEGKKLANWIEKQTTTCILIDLKNSDYFGSTTVGVFMRWWKLARTRQGKLAMCNLSSHAQELIKITQLDKLWHICATRDEGLSWLTQA